MDYVKHAAALTQIWFIIVREHNAPLTTALLHAAADVDNVSCWEQRVGLGWARALLPSPKVAQNLPKVLTTY